MKTDGAPNPERSDEQRDHAFRRAGLGGEVTRGRHPAVVVIDLQLGFTDPEHPLGSECSAVVESTSRILRTAHTHDAPVFFSVIAYAPGEKRVWFDKMPQLSTLLAGTRATEIDERLPREAGDTVLVKHGPSAAFDTTLIADLRSAGVDTVVVTGVTTSGCVRATVVDLVSAGFSVLVPRQAVGDRAAGPHHASLIDIQAKYGDVVDEDDVIGFVSRTAP